MRQRKEIGEAKEGGERKYDVLSYLVVTPGTDLHSTT